MPAKTSPIRYPGGKSAALEQLRKFIPPGRSLLSPFIGGGSLEIDSAKRGLKVLGFDSYGPLVCFWNEIARYPDGLYKAVMALHPLNDQIFFDAYDNLHLLPDGLDKAAKFFLLNYTTWKGMGQSGGRSKAEERFTPTIIGQIKHFSAPNLTVSNKDFRDSLKMHPHMFTFLDPPYIMDKPSLESFYGTKGSHHKDFDHQSLFEYLKDRDQWVMTHRDCEEIRQIYSDFPIDEFSWRYSMNNEIGNELVIKSRDHARSTSISMLITKPNSGNQGIACNSASLTRWLTVGENNPIARAIEVARFDINEVVEGNAQIAIISGLPGLGKSRLIKEATECLEKQGVEVDTCQFRTIHDLDDAVFRANGQAVIVADEADSLLRSKAQIERLKLIADPKGPKILDIGSGLTHRKLKLNCRLLMTFNADIHVKDQQIQIQLDALFSRKAPVEIKGNREELWEYTVYLALTSNLINNFRYGKISYGASLSSFSTAIDWFSSNIWNLKEVSPRSLEKVLEIVSRHQKGLGMTSSQMQGNLAQLCTNHPKTNINLPLLENWESIRRSFLAMRCKEKASDLLMRPAPTLLAA